MWNRRAILFKRNKKYLNDKKIFFKEESGDKIQEPNIELIEFEKDMIRATLLLNPENLDLSPDELDKRVNKEYLDSRDWLVFQTHSNGHPKCGAYIDNIV